MYTLDERLITKCDRCGRKVTRYGEDLEGDNPEGWAEMTCNIWVDGKPESYRGNERQFAELCPKCIKDCGINFHWAGEDLNA